MKILYIFLFFTLTTLAYPADVQVFFSPSGGCTDTIVNALNASKTEVLVQAYAFTSAPIAKALRAAHERGVNVTAVLDKSNQAGKYSVATFLQNAGIPVFIDYHPAIAHNKIMVIDRESVITGSFNFTKSAEEKNTENLLVIKNDEELVKRYIENFQSRLKESRKF